MILTILKHFFDRKFLLLYLTTQKNQQPQMDNIYTGDYLTITHEKENSLFIQSWNESLDNVENFKKEMLVYTSLYKKLKPKHTLWLHKTFKLNLDANVFNWIENEVNIPCLKYGNIKCAFVVSKDILAHLTVIDSFDNIKSCIDAKHFIGEEEAREWIFKNETHQSKSISQSKIKFEGVDENGDLIIKISSKNIKQTFKTVSKLIEDEKHIEHFKNKENSLTKREKNILQLVSKGRKHQDIAKDLFISIHTVRTHVKNIKIKLNFENESEFSSFLKTYYS